MYEGQKKKEIKIIENNFDCCQACSGNIVW